MARAVNGSPPARLPALILCGPLIAAPNHGLLSEARAGLSHAGLLERCSAEARRLPDLLQTLPGSALNEQTLQGLAALCDWLVHGRSLDSTKLMSNATTMPLTVLLHVGSYLNFLTSSGLDQPHEAVLRSVLSHGVHGFCAGLLSALAISFANSTHSMADMVSHSVRLAACIGAYVDADAERCDASHRVCGLSVRWDPEATTLTHAEGIMQAFDGVSNVQSPCSLCAC